MDLRLRADQTVALDRIAQAFQLSRSDLMRLALDQFTSAIEEGPFLARLEEVEVGP